MHIIERSLRRFAPALPPPVPPSEVPKTAAPPANAASHLAVVMPHLQWAIPVVLQVQHLRYGQCDCLGLSLVASESAPQRTRPGRHSLTQVPPALSGRRLTPSGWLLQFVRSLHAMWSREIASGPLSAAAGALQMGAKERAVYLGHRLSRNIKARDARHSIHQCILCCRLRAAIVCQHSNPRRPSRQR